MIKKILSGLFFCLLASSVFAGQGWYLLVPWSTPPQAPIADWDHSHGSYDTAKECQNALSDFIQLRERLKELGKGHCEANKNQPNYSREIELGTLHSLR